MEVMEAKKLEVIGMLKFDIDLSEFCKGNDFTTLSKDDLTSLVKTLGRAGEPVSKDLREEIIEALSTGSGYTDFLKSEEFVDGDKISAEGSLIIELLEQLPYRSDFSIAIKKNDDNHYEFKLTTDVDYIPYKDFVKNLTNNDINLWEKIYNLNEGGSIDEYDVDKDSSLYALYEDAQNGSNKLFRNEDGIVTIRLQHTFFVRYGDQIRNNIRQLLNDDYANWKEAICSETTERLVNGDIELRDTNRFRTGLYNMDDLYLKALDMFAKTFVKNKNRQLEPKTNTELEASKRANTELENEEIDR